jgi:hypothetical protein
MTTISVKISKEVYDEIAKLGKFGDVVDDVLRRVLGLSPKPGPRSVAEKPGRRGRGNHRIALKKMTPRVEKSQLRANGDRLSIAFRDGAANCWELPERSDREGIRPIRDEAVLWAKQQGASEPGQTNAVKKALTDAGYYIR